MGRPRSIADEEPESLLDAIQAMGASLWEGLGQMAAIPGGPALARRTWANYLKTGPRGAELALALAEFGADAPRLAMELCRVWLQGRHIDGTLDL